MSKDARMLCFMHMDDVISELNDEMCKYGSIELDLTRIGDKIPKGATDRANACYTPTERYGQESAISIAFDLKFAQA
jgi:hypothetical protein